MTRHRGTHRPTSTRRGRAPVFLLLLLGTFLLLLPGHDTVSAQRGPEDTPVRTTPIDGEILTRWARAAVASFPTQIDPDSSTLRLVDINGGDVEGVTLDFPADRVSMSLGLPAGIPDGVYSLVWDATTTDGERIIGYSSFSVGNPEDAGIITIPTDGGGADGPPSWLQTGGRWSALVGIIAAMAIWPVWTAILRPSLAPMWRRGPGVVLAMQQFAFIAFSLAFLGSLLELAVHSQTMPEGTWLDKFMNTVGHTSWGSWWLLRMLLLVTLGIGLAVTAWWYPRRRPVKLTAAWILSLLVPLPVSMSSHAADDSVGQFTAVASDHLHLLSAGLWVGSAVVIATVLLPHLRGVDSARVGAVFRILGPRLAGLTIIAWIILALTGAYATWLHAGSWTAMTSTDYGRALLVKLGLTVIGIALVAWSILAVRRMATTSDPAAHGRLGWLLIAQGVLVLVILVTVGRMSTVPTARTIVTEQSQQRAVEIDLDGRASRYLIAPGRVGVNHLRLEIPGDYIPNDAEAFVTISSPDHPEIGTKEFQMYRVPGNAFEHHGTEFAFVGDWDVSLRFVEPGFEDRTSSFSHVLAEDVDAPDVPGRAWKFETAGGAAALLLFVVGAAGIVIGVILGGPTRKEASGLGTAALALAVVLLLQARIDDILAVEQGEGAINPNDIAMVTRGEDVYRTYCINCHGPELRGDGPLNENLNPPAADFAAPHTFVHSDADLIFWIQNGKQGTAMPGFDAQLTDQDMRDVVAFIQNWQQEFVESGGDASSPVGATMACDVAPIPFSRIPEIFHHGLMPEIPRGTPLIQAADATVDGDTANNVMWSVEQIAACTNEDLTLSRLRLFSEPLLMELFPNGADQRLTTATTSQPQPLGPGEQVSIGDVQSITRLADGRIAVSVIFNDPAGVGVVPGAGVITQVTLVMLEQEDGWIVDELR